MNEGINLKGASSVAHFDTFADRRYSLALETLSENPADKAAQDNFEIAYTTQAQVEGLFARAVGDSAIAEAKGKDAASAMWVALGADVVKAVPFGTLVTRVGGGEAAKALVTFTTNRTRDATAAAASARWGQATAAELDTQEEIAKRAQATAEARILTTLATYPKLLARPLPDNNEWSPGGRLKSVDAMGGFASESWMDAKTTLLDEDDGAGRYFKKKIFDGAYEGEFRDFYDNEKWTRHGARARRCPGPGNRRGVYPGRQGPASADLDRRGTQSRRPRTRSLDRTVRDGV